MATIQWRPEPKPPHHAVEHPNYNEELAESILDLGQEMILQRLISGENVTFANAFSYTLSFMGRLEGPDDALPPLDECLHIRVHAAPALVEALRQAARLERLPPEKKLPLISAALDTVLELKDVLNPQGLLQLNGSNLSFDRKQGAGECVIEGTAQRAGASCRPASARSRTARSASFQIFLCPGAPVEQRIHRLRQHPLQRARHPAHRHLRTPAALTADCGQARPPQSPGSGHPHWQRGQPACQRHRRQRLSG